MHLGLTILKETLYIYFHALKMELLQLRNMTLSKYVNCSDMLLIRMGTGIAHTIRPKSNKAGEGVPNSPQVV